MKRLLLTVFFYLLIQLNVQAQDPLARIKYLEAEEFFTAGNYKASIAKLDEAEKLLGSSNPKILFLKIMAQDQLLLTIKDLYESMDNYDLLSAFRKNGNKYTVAYNSPELADKNMEVYKALERHPPYSGSRADFEAAVTVRKAELERLNREKEEQLRLQKIKEEQERKDAELREKVESEKRQKDRKEWNTYGFFNLGFQSGSIGKYGLLIEGFEQERSSGFRMAVRGSFISGETVKKFDNSYAPVGAPSETTTKEGKFEIDLGRNIRIMHPLYLYAGIGFGSYTKWTRYQVWKSGYLDSEIWGSFGDEAGVVYFANSLGLMLRPSRGININAGLSFMNFKNPELTFGISFNLMPKL
jgi:hypothetical protein